MIELVLGAKGKGKTRTLVDRANNESKITNGSVLYIDKSNKHMYELSNIIRLINLNDYDINSKEAFIGFVQGIISSNYSLTHIFLDNFKMLSCIEKKDIGATLEEIDKLSVKYDINFIIAIAAEESDIPEKYKSKIGCIL